MYKIYCLYQKLFFVFANSFRLKTLKGIYLRALSDRYDAFFGLFLMGSQFWRKKTLRFYADASFNNFIKRKEDFAALTLTWNKNIIRRAKHKKGPVEIITLATRV